MGASEFTAGPRLRECIKTTLRAQVTNVGSHLRLDSEASIKQPHCQDYCKYEATTEC